MSQRNSDEYYYIIFLLNIPKNFLHCWELKKTTENINWRISGFNFHLDARSFYCIAFMSCFPCGFSFGMKSNYPVGKECHNACVFSLPAAKLITFHLKIIIMHNFIEGRVDKWGTIINNKQDYNQNLFLITEMAMAINGRCQIFVDTELEKKSDKNWFGFLWNHKFWIFPQFPVPNVNFAFVVYDTMNAIFSN